MQFRMATQDDLDFIYHATRNMAEEEGILSRYSCTPDSLQAGLFGPDAFAEVLLAEKAGVPLGLCLFSKTQRNFNLFPAPGIYIHDIYVCPEARRQKIGTALTAKMKDIAKQRGCHRVDWVILKQNQPALAFWQAVGVGEEVDYIKTMRAKL